jgi:hypothetical protein
MNPNSTRCGFRIWSIHTRACHKAVLSDIEYGLRDLGSAMADDIKEAEREEKP